MNNPNILSEEQINSKIDRNIYPYSNYYKGQKVIAQKNRPTNPDDVGFCPGIIEEIYDNHTYLIIFQNNDTKILSKKYFYAQNQNSKDEMKNYENYLNQSYGIGAKVKANINQNNNEPADIQSGTITNANLEHNSFEVTFSNGFKIDNIPLENIYNSCNYYIEPPVTITTSENIEEEEKNVIPVEECQNLRFDSYGFIMQNKNWFGLIFIIISIYTFLISIKKIYQFDDLDPGNGCPNLFNYDENTFKPIILFKKLCIFICKLLNTKIANFIFQLITIGIMIIFYFFMIILVNKNFRSMKAIVIYAAIILFLLFLFKLNSNNQEFVIDLSKSDNSLTSFLLKIGWSILMAFSLGPLFISLYLIFIVPNYILKLLNYSDYQIDFIQYITGKRPECLSILIYFVIIAVVFSLNVVLISYSFNGIVQVPKQYSDNTDLTTSLNFRIKQIIQGFNNYIKNNQFTVIYLSVIIVYFIIKYYLPRTFLGNIQVFNLIISFIPKITTKIVIYLIIFYFILKLFIYKMWPSLKKLDFNQLLKELHLDGFVRGLKDANADITTQKYSQKNLPPKQIYDIGNVR